MKTAFFLGCSLGALLALGGCSSDAGTSAPGQTSGGKKPPCLAKPSQVVAIGDSYVASPVVLVPKLVQLAIADGALMQGDTYRDYSVPGTTLDTPVGAGSIPPQWTMAKQADSGIKAVIMDGGGNDILASLTCILPGSDMNATCTGIVDRVTEVARVLMQDMKATGVTDIVDFLYPDVPAGGKDISTYADTKAQDVTAMATSDSFRIHLIDTRPAFAGHPEYFSAADPIHPNAMGGQVIAELVWDTMKSSCIAQPASSGCCAP